MNNKEHNFKYKYLKYKNKYLDLKNQIGGIHFNKELTQCIADDYDNGKYDGYNYYDPLENKCCKNKIEEKYTDCHNLVHTIDRTQIYPESKIFRVEFPFSKNERYEGTTVIDVVYKDTTILEKVVEGTALTKLGKDTNQIKIYKYFNKYDSNDVILEKFELLTIISSGSFGTVFRYKTEKTKKFIAVKYGMITQDIKVLKEMQEKKVCSELVIDSIPYLNKIRCIIMQHAVGSIAELIPAIKLNKNILVDILYAIVIAIKCLSDNGLYYTDIKMGNILYRNTPQKGIQIILGDIGGAGDISVNPVGSYKPYEDLISIKQKTFTSDINIRQCIISWCIGILTLSLLGIDHTQIDFKNEETKKKINGKSLDEIDSYVFLEVKKIIEELKDNYIIDLIRGTLCQFSQRINLTQILEKLIVRRLQQPVLQQPVLEQPVLEQPVLEQPALEQPVLEQPVLEQPAPEQHALEQHALEQPALEQPALEQPAKNKRRSLSFISNQTEVKKPRQNVNELAFNK